MDFPPLYLFTKPNRKSRSRGQSRGTNGLWAEAFRPCSAGFVRSSVPKQVRGACTSTYQLAITLGSELSGARRGCPGLDCSSRRVQTPCSPPRLLILHRNPKHGQLGIMAYRHRLGSRLLSHPRCRNLLCPRIPSMAHRKGPRGPS